MAYTWYKIPIYNHGVLKMIKINRISSALLMQYLTHPDTTFGNLKNFPDIWDQLIVLATKRGLIKLQKEEVIQNG
jgi:hypothetical protein